MTPRVVYALADRLSRPFGSAIARAVHVVLRRTSLKAGVAVVYHRLEDDPGPPENHLAACHSTRLFVAQVRHLTARYRPVKATELQEAVRGRRRGERFPVAITFDDDLRTHVTTALPLLSELGTKATFFLCGTPRAESACLWWERLQEAWEEGQPIGRLVPGLQPQGESPPTRSSALLHEAAGVVRDMSPADRDQVATTLARRFPRRPAWAGLEPEDVRRVAGQGHEIGFHTRRHYSLPTLDDARLRAAVEEGRQELAEAAGTAVQSLAYPHGRGDERVATAARAAGYRAAFTCAKSACVPGTDPMLIGRVEASVVSRGHLALRLAGALWDAWRER